MNSIIPTDVLFPEASLWAIGCIVVSYFLGFFVRGTFGFGSNIPILLLTTPILGPHHAIVLVAAAALFPRSTCCAKECTPQTGGLKTAHCWDARLHCRRYLVADLMDGRVAHRNDGVADYGDRRDGSIPIAGTAVYMGRPSVTKVCAGACGDGRYRGHSERGRSALFLGCLSEVGLSKARYLPQHQPGPVGLFHDRAHVVFYHRRPRHIPDNL